MSSDTLFFKQVEEWEAKRKSIQVQLSDLPNLVAGHVERSSRPYAPDGRYRLVDAAPTVRLANACEAIANCLYSVAEIAANFANRASKGALPTSFNAIRKKCADFPTSELSAALGDLQWYRKVRELRTEWAHYSSIFIAENKQGEVMLCVRAYRRESDMQEFAGPNFSCTIDQFIEWVRNAIVTLDDFAGFVLKMFVLPLPRVNQGETQRQSG